MAKAEFDAILVAHAETEVKPEAVAAIKAKAAAEAKAEATVLAAAEAETRELAARGQARLVRSK